jgi:hypothetical protein
VIPLALGNDVTYVGTYVAKKSSGSLSRVSTFGSSSPPMKPLTFVLEVTNDKFLLGSCGTKAVVEARETVMRATIRVIVFNMVGVVVCL